MSTPENTRRVTHLADLSRELDQAVMDLGRYEDMAVEAEADYKLAHSHAMKDAAGPMDLRKAEATIQCDELFRTCGKAAALVTMQRAHIKALHTRIDVGRTLQATARAEVNLTGLGT
ncbi:hypothetical protein Q8791_23235 [Nocardiopsis sp. CT-R113]|uniref:Uncharacterized protein n=1 Tax=Nocardiopsis codii TaxID=3065942 RepID=A0ABU7KD25_9ACTN|nr:hypothetical protein [Nocardiopsis sp. CT-R113]MEE2040136.1 hypothetical protein [Nocardiopsis sp. CT-R113]